MLRLLSCLPVPTRILTTDSEFHSFARQIRRLEEVGLAVTDLDAVVAAVPAEETFVVIDGYHGFMAVPTDLAPIAERAFYLAGGYKYAMAGEGACFLHCPPGYGERPINTGWFAGFAPPALRHLPRRERRQGTLPPPALRAVRACSR